MKADLRCTACGKYLGDNNALITTGPPMGARPTDLTQFCELTGKQEAVIDASGHLEAVQHENSWWFQVASDESRRFPKR